MDKWGSIIAIATYWGIGLATVIVADRAGMVSQSSPITYFIGAFLRAWGWPAFWFWKAREALFGF